jgi:hypothetical protein
MRAVILVPRRLDHGSRDATWVWVKDWWQKNLPDLPIYEGHHNGGLFNRSAALNLAAHEAKGSIATQPWDVALVIDADVICDPEQVQEALERAHAEQRIYLAFSRRHNLNERGSLKVMAGEQGSWRRYIGKTYNDMASSAIAIPRATWDLLEGFDEKFEGWGFEDSAFALAYETLTGSTIQKVPGELWHFWHPTAPEGKRGTPSYTANRERMEAYRAALGNREVTRGLIAGEMPLPLPRVIVENIPRILHRTVPAETSPIVEAYWKRFKALHPGWEYMTHRDPLKPSEWPLTAHRWHDCTSGAQLAGLIRLEALYRWGGIYVDSDCEPYRSLEPLLGLHAFAGWEDKNVVPDAVLGAEPEHPAILACLQLALRTLTKGPWHSGPGVTTRLLPNRSDVALLPPGSFYPYHYNEKGRNRENHKANQPWAFMAHHWAGSWLKDKVDSPEGMVG